VAEQTNSRIREEEEEEEGCEISFIKIREGKNFCAIGV
jgi:hypothetical protein